MSAVFVTTPEIGTRLWINDQRYELVSVAPYVRKTDGVATFLLEWEGRCCTDGCGAPFRTSSTMTVTRLKRRCDEHKDQRSPASRKKRVAKVRVELA
ncbi:hypothetical protein [Sphingomonas sp. BK069]|uniref:hypothetical protein n=1 Tax=Sphingomonas sp. BK069 TaxID=2586979 RepID=UPI00160B9A55|nr:hypothetical protein [Sphingomonas sp. BK069]MBB3347334.1 hypothetical protein [Sphingomonas sp. BK069]